MLVSHQGIHNKLWPSTLGISFLKLIVSFFPSLGYNSVKRLLLFDPCSQPHLVEQGLVVVVVQ